MARVSLSPMCALVPDLLQWRHHVLACVLARGRVHVVGMQCCSCTLSRLSQELSRSRTNTTGTPETGQCWTRRREDANEQQTQHRRHNERKKEGGTCLHGGLLKSDSNPCNYARAGRDIFSKSTQRTPAVSEFTHITCGSCNSRV